MNLAVLRSTAFLCAMFLFIALPVKTNANTLKLYTGNPLPPFELPGLFGETYSLEDYRGKILLVNFWATWCPACIKEMPSMERLENHLEGKPFSLLAINMGEDPNVLSDFLKHFNVDLTVAVDSNSTVTRDWGLFAYPTSFLVDGTGRVTHVVHGELNWDSPEVKAVMEQLITTIPSHSSSNVSPTVNVTPDGSNAPEGLSQ